MFNRQNLSQRLTNLSRQRVRSKINQNIKVKMLLWKTKGACLAYYKRERSINNVHPWNRERETWFFADVSVYALTHGEGAYTMYRSIQLLPVSLWSVDTLCNDYYSTPSDQIYMPPWRYIKLSLNFVLQLILSIRSSCIQNFLIFIKDAG